MPDRAPCASDYQVPERRLASVLAPEPGVVGFVGLEGSEVLDGWGQAGTFQQVAGRMLVAGRLSLAEREADHGPQDQGRGERMSGR